MLQQAESEERYREVVARLKRLLDVERRNLRAVRAAHAKDLQSRTELETLLRACVDDVRKEIAAQRAGGGGGAGGGSPAKDKVGVDDLAHSERERVLECCCRRSASSRLPTSARPRRARRSGRRGGGDHGGSKRRGDGGCGYRAHVAEEIELKRKVGILAGPD